MKLTFDNIEVERSGNFKSEKFGIGNSRVIMEILRGKMYSNPIQTICQEIMSNARDAHREVGKNEVPIQVKLPSKLESTFWIRDYGPGISPDRMANVFILYGVSTKRSDNVQTGGFGLGAKSPFSYSDTFSIISITVEEGKRIKRQYIAHLDETGVGEMSCVQETETDEHRGTTISITPRPKDFAAFKYYTMRAAVFWGVKPEILGDAGWEWPAVNTFHKGDRWFITDSGKRSHTPYMGSFQHSRNNTQVTNFNYTVPCITDSAPYALIDGIPYKIKLQHIYQGSGRAGIFGRIPFKLHFEVGEVPVTANREDIDYQSWVIDHIKERLETSLTQLKKLLTKKLRQTTDLREAINYWRKLTRQTYGQLLKEHTWNGIYLKKFDRMRIDEKDEIRVAAFRRDNSTRHGCRKTNSYYHNFLRVDDDTILVEDDTGDRGISRARLASLLDKYPEHRYILILDFSKKLIKQEDEKGEKSIKTVAADEKLIEKRKALADTKYHWSDLKPIKLSQIPKKTLPKEPKEKKARSRSKVVRTKIFDPKTKKWIQPEKIPEKETKHYLQVSGTTCWLDRGSDTRLTTSRLFELLVTCHAAKIDLVIYGVVPSHVKNLDDTWKPLGPHLNNLLDEIGNNLAKNGMLRDHYAAYRCFPSSIWKIFCSPKFLKRLTPGKPFHKYIKASLKSKTTLHQLHVHNKLAAVLKKPRIYPQYKKGNKLEKLHAEFMDCYPLIAPVIGKLNLNKDSVLEDVLEYVNIKNKEV